MSSTIVSRLVIASVPTGFPAASEPSVAASDFRKSACQSASLLSSAGSALRCAATACTTSFATIAVCCERFPKIGLPIGQPLVQRGIRFAMRGYRLYHLVCDDRGLLQLGGCDLVP